MTKAVAKLEAVRTAGVVKVNVIKGLSVPVVKLPFSLVRKLFIDQWMTHKANRSYNKDILILTS